MGSAPLNVAVTRDAASPTAVAAAKLTARTVALGTRPDLLAVGGRPGGMLWQRESEGLAGFGVAVRIALPGGLDVANGVDAVSETLGAIDTDDRVGLPGCGPVALGALPFDRRAATSVVVPRWIVGRRGDAAWITSIGAPDDVIHIADPFEALRTLEGGGPTGEPPDAFTLTSALPHAVWCGLVRDAVGRIHAGDLAKVVLSRKVDVTTNRPFLIPDVLDRLTALYPACMIFHVDGFIGASPELLVERHRDAIRSVPLAGTVARSGDLAADQRLVSELLASVKDRSEHRFVIDELMRLLSPLCTELTVPSEPEILALRNVSHLATPLVGRLRGDPAPTALALVARIHPTPAVAGTPTAAAVDHIQQVEGYDRGPFAGPVGWMDHRGDGSWALGIRSARVSGNHASMYAGVGVVADSDPAAELAESQLKLQALLAALVRP